ncbi:MAG: hypothetical protein GWP68_07945 [Verrucomicrobiaceae bacterium]|nr:hypothetical protein [Verrucomicrobiaceae bacterium]
MKIITVVLLTVVLTLGALFMIGPQIVFIVPLAIGAGITLGYPLVFGLVSAYVGYFELPGYERTLAFAVSVAIGAVGVGLMALGLWKTIPSRGSKSVSEPGDHSAG